MSDLGGAYKFLRSSFWIINTISRSTQ